MAALALSIKAHLLWPSVALGLALLWLCVSLYGRIERLRYAYHETEKENEKLHIRLAEAERQLQYLRQLTENVDTALFVCSTDGRIDWMNHAGEKTLYGLSPNPSPVREGNFTREGLGERPGNLPPHILSAIAEHAEVVDGCALSTVMLRIDGHRRLIVALKDVSMLMQQQEMEAWQQLIRVLTHEIMNSLTPIISISETLAGSLPQGGGQEGAAVINRRCHALLDFVESYRQLTRIKTPERATFPVSELFEHVKALFPKLSTPLPHREGQGGESPGGGSPVSLSYPQAISFLRREALVLPAETPRGIVAVSYEGHVLGYVKNIGNRANNLYPKEWRIKSTYVPDTPPQILTMDD